MAGHFSDDDDFRKILKEASKKGVIVIAAAGNTPYKMGNISILNKVAKPASYPETIAVCGSNADEKIWHDTCRGEEIDICSPAEDIRRARAGWVDLTRQINDTDKSEGTSMSTALVSSVAALWLSYHGYENLVDHYSNDPSKIPEAFRKIIKTTGHRRPQHWDTGSFGAGIIDAALVLKSPLPSV